MASRPLGRLRKGREFDTAYSKGTVTNGPLFVVRVFPNGLGHNRWGFAVGKKLAPSAVDSVRRSEIAAIRCRIGWSGATPRASIAGRLR